MVSNFGKSVIVVGGGTSGAVVARRLVDAGLSVTLLEAGAEDTNPAIHDPSRASELWGSAEDWGYATVPQPHAGGRELHLPRGRVLGGSHALNAMIWVRGSRHDYDAWEKLGNVGWGWDAALPVFKEIEDYSGGASDLRGADGILPVNGGYPIAAINQAFIDAAAEAGLPINPDYNGATLDGVSQQQVTMRDGVRVTTWSAYLKPVRERLRIVTGAEVRSVIVEEGRAVGIRFRLDGEESELRADQIVLSAGTLGSAAILLRSGIGPADELGALGIPVVKDAPGVGKNLHDHFLVPVVGYTTTRDIGPRVSGVSGTQVHVFWRSRPELDVPDTQPILFTTALGGSTAPGQESAFTLAAGLITPRSRGSVTLSGPDIDDPLRIDLGTLSAQEDVEALLASVRQMRALIRQPALAESWGAREASPGEHIADDDLEDYVRNNVMTYHHQVGTCRMGVDAEAVVDPRLRVNGIDGLRVMDASIMPTITSGNTNAPAVLIGELGAKFLLEEMESAA